MTDQCIITVAMFSALAVVIIVFSFFINANCDEISRKIKDKEDFGKDLSGLIWDILVIIITAIITIGIIVIALMKDVCL